MIYMFSRLFRPMVGWFFFLLVTPPENRPKRSKRKCHLNQPSIFKDELLNFRGVYYILNTVHGYINTCGYIVLLNLLYMNGVFLLGEGKP